MGKTLGKGSALLLAVALIGPLSGVYAADNSNPSVASPHGTNELKVKVEGHEGAKVTVNASEQGADVSVSCIDPHTCCKESEKVLETLQTMVKALNNGDWKTYENYLDDHCTTFDENSKKLIAGKENVLADMRAKVDKYAQNGTPFVSVTIDHPYAKVMGETAVVTLVAIRQYGGKHPFKEECKVTDVFVKHGETWKKCHFRGAWKRV